MAILNIIKDGDPVLRKKCRPVSDITPRIIQLIDDMKETLIEADGVGLAAPQVGVLKRIAIVVGEDGQIYEMINPEIAAFEGNQKELEGCLSVPGKWAITDRPMRVTVKATDRNGKEYKVFGEGLTARAFCHEIDHLNGLLFTDNAIRVLTSEELEQLQK